MSIGNGAVAAEGALWRVINQEMRPVEMDCTEPWASHTLMEPGLSRAQIHFLDTRKLAEQ